MIFISLVAIVDSFAEIAPYMKIQESGEDKSETANNVG